MSFAKNMGKIIVKNISKNLCGKYSQKLLDYAKQSTIDALKAISKKVIQKTAEPTGNLIGNKNADKITKISKTLQENNSETITNEHDKKIPKEKYISTEERQKIIDNQRLI